MAALESLPQPFRDLVKDVRCFVADSPRDDVLDELGIESEFDLMGLFTGVGLPQEGITPTGQLPNTVQLYRRPILDYWAETDEETLGESSPTCCPRDGPPFRLLDDDMEHGRRIEGSRRSREGAPTQTVMSHTTQGTLLLDKLGIAYTLHPYAYDPDAPRVGLQAAEALGVDPARLSRR